MKMEDRMFNYIHVSHSTLCSVSFLPGFLLHADTLLFMRFFSLYCLRLDLPLKNPNFYIKNNYLHFFILIPGTSKNY